LPSIRGSMAGSAGKPSPPKILGPQPKPEAGVLLQIILRVPPVCGWSVFGAAVVAVLVEAGAILVDTAVVVTVLVVVAKGVVLAVAVVVVVVVVVVPGRVVVVVLLEQAAVSTSTRTSKRQKNKVIFDLYIFFLLIAHPFAKRCYYFSSTEKHPFFPHSLWLPIATGQ
jgi:hypothetical protein